MQNRDETSPRFAVRRIAAALIAATAAIVWTHALAGVLRSAAGVTPEALAPAAAWLSLGAGIAAAVASLAAPVRRRVAGLGGFAGAVAVLAIAVLHPAALVPALALVPATIGAALAGAAIGGRMPADTERLVAAHRVLAAGWIAIALLAVVQVGRLSTYMSDPTSDWFLSTRHPFYAKHECLNAYVFAAELNRRGEPNVYRAEHYPGLNPAAKPETAMRGMAPEDPYQYVPQFLLLPRLAIALTSDHVAIRLLWFGLNVTLCLGAVLALASWVGGRRGLAAGLLTPVLLAAFPVLHNFQYGQFHFAAIALAVLALVLVARGRSAFGGALLAAAILSKLFPAIVLVPWLLQRRWAALGWTATASAVLSGLAFATLGSEVFTAFVDYHLPRLLDGRAFAFGEAWPELAGLVTAGNQGAHGIVHKLVALGVPGIDASMTRIAGALANLAVLAAAIAIGLRAGQRGRAARATAWLGLLGLASLTSPGAWADYVPLTCVWALVWMLPAVRRRPIAMPLAVASLALQATLVGTMPLGSWVNPRFMLTVSLLGSLAMFATFATAVTLAVRAPNREARRASDALPEARTAISGA